MTPLELFAGDDASLRLYTSMFENARSFKVNVVGVSSLDVCLLVSLQPVGAFVSLTGCDGFPKCSRSGRRAQMGVRSGGVVVFVALPFFTPSYRLGLGALLRGTALVREFWRLVLLPTLGCYLSTRRDKCRWNRASDRSSRRLGSTISSARWPRRGLVTCSTTP